MRAAELLQVGLQRQTGVAAWTAVAAASVGAAASSEACHTPSPTDTMKRNTLT